MGFHQILVFFAWNNTRFPWRLLQPAHQRDELILIVLQSQAIPEDGGEAAGNQQTKRELPLNLPVVEQHRQTMRHCEGEIVIDHNTWLFSLVVHDIWCHKEQRQQHNYICIYHFVGTP